MAYPAGYPMAYPQYYPQYQPQPQQQSNNSIIWVSGEAGAKAYLVAPNTTVQLWDSEAQVIYLKSADASGMPSIKVLDYTIRQTPGNGPVAASTAPAVNSNDYATRAEVTALQGEINALKAELGITTKKGAALNE